MKIYSLENTKRNVQNNNLYDLFKPLLKTYINNVKEYKVNEDREMRIDLISIDIYGNDNYVDELLHLNGIIDPYSIKKDDVIYYTDRIDLMKLSYYDDQINKKDSNKNITPTYVPDGTNPVIVDQNTKQIKIQ